MPRSQVQERLDAGDRAGAIREHVRTEVVPKLKRAQQAEQDEVMAALHEFVRRYPEADTEFTGRMLAETLKQLGLSGRNIDEMEQAYLVMQEKFASVVEAEAMRQVRPRQVTKAPQPLQTPTPAPVAPAESALDAAANEMIRSGLTRQAFNNLTAKETEMRMMDPVFQHAVEILFPEAEPNLLTRGDHVRGSQVIRAAEIAGADLAEAARAVAASREAHAQAFANYSAPKTGPEGGIVRPGDRCMACVRGLQCTVHGARAPRRNMTLAEAKQNELRNGPRTQVKSRGDLNREAGKARRDEIESRFRR
jgi:hypothetical protein